VVLATHPERSPISFAAICSCTILSKMSTLRILGRTLLAAIFILGGINKLPNPGSIVGYTTAKLSAFGDFVPQSLLTPQAVLVMLYIAASESPLST
jgi:hypothetical protein